LAFHQAESGPVMEQLRARLSRQFEERLVEPNSALGAAIATALWHYARGVAFAAKKRISGSCPCARTVRSLGDRPSTLFFETRFAMLALAQPLPEEIDVHACRTVVFAQVLFRSHPIAPARQMTVAGRCPELPLRALRTASRPPAHVREARDPQWCFSETDRARFYVK
jgi:hypothetical protein